MTKMIININKQQNNCHGIILPSNSKSYIIIDYYGIGNYRKQKWTNEWTNEWTRRNQRRENKYFNLLYFLHIFLIHKKTTNHILTVYSIIHVTTLRKKVMALHWVVIMINLVQVDSSFWEVKCLTWSKEKFTEAVKKKTKKNKQMLESFIISPSPKTNVLS